MQHEMSRHLRRCDAQIALYAFDDRAAELRVPCPSLELGCVERFEQAILIGLVLTYSGITHLDMHATRYVHFSGHR